VSSRPPPRKPKPSEESGWSLEALLDAFGSSLPRLFRRFGVRPSDIDDATQDAHFVLWLKRHAIPTDPTGARDEVFRLVALVARDCFRDAQGRRIVYMHHVDAPSTLDTEEWIASCMLWSKALDSLDKRSRDLIVAHKLDEKTFDAIGAESGEPPDTIRKRFNVAYAKFENEVNRLLGKQRKPKRSAAIIFGLTPFDRAVLRAVLEAEEQVPPPPPTSAVHSTAAASKSATFGGWPIGLLAGTLVMMPGELSSAPQVLQAAKISDVPLRDVVVAAPIPAPPPVLEAPVLAPENRSKSLQEKQARRPAPSRKLDKETAASFRGVVTKRGSLPP
jgi:DNA-directed RNA polymerase specialized sigma24 family protein